MGCGEDIPEVVLTQDLPWNWQSFPDYLDSLAQRSYDADIATQIGHAPLRVYVMGQRGADREPSTEADRADMARLAGEALRAGALGFSTSRPIHHRRRHGKQPPTQTAREVKILTKATPPTD